jgi:hypothetical protein
MLSKNADQVIADHKVDYAPLITLDEAATIARVPIGSVYDWSARGLFDEFKTKPGRAVLLHRDSFLNFICKTNSTATSGTKEVQCPGSPM